MAQDEDITFTIKKSKIDTTVRLVDTVSSLPKIQPTKSVKIYWIYASPLSGLDQMEYAGNMSSYGNYPVQYRIPGDTTLYNYEAMRMEVGSAPNIKGYDSPDNNFTAAMRVAARKLKPGIVVCFKLYRKENGVKVTDTIYFRLISLAKTKQLKRQNTARRSTKS